MLYGGCIFNLFTEGQLCYVSMLVEDHIMEVGQMMCNTTTINNKETELLNVNGQLSNTLQSRSISTLYSSKEHLPAQIQMCQYLHK